MAYPSDHAYPASLPVWLIEGHQLRAGERVAVTQFDQGEDRHREIRTFTPFLVRVSTVLETQADFDLFDEFYEANLKSGELRFDTKIAGLDGSRTQWWVAQFMGPYRVEIPKQGISIVSAELFVSDGPYDVTLDSDGEPVPRDPPSLYGRALADSEGTATFAAGTLMGWTAADSEGWAIQSNSLIGISEADSEGQGELALADFLLLEGDQSGYVLLEGDQSGKIYLEP
jgi:hypothetical protein